MEDKKYLFRLSDLYEQFTPNSEEYRLLSSEIICTTNYKDIGKDKITVKDKEFIVQWEKEEKKQGFFNELFSSPYPMNGTFLASDMSEVYKIEVNSLTDPSPFSLYDVTGQMLIESRYSIRGKTSFTIYYMGEEYFVTERPHGWHYLRDIPVPYKMFKEISFWQHLFRHPLRYDRVGFFIKEEDNIPSPVMLTIAMLGRHFTSDTNSLSIIDASNQKRSMI